MSLQKFFQWCYQSPVLGILRDSSYAMPIIQSIHLLGLTRKKVQRTHLIEHIDIGGIAAAKCRGIARG